jgi:hypothetical protein
MEESEDNIETFGRGDRTIVDKWIMAIAPDDSEGPSYAQTLSDPARRWRLADCSARTGCDRRGARASPPIGSRG